MAEVRGCYHELSKKRFPSIDFKKIAQQPSQKDLQSAEQAWSDLVATETSFSSNYWDEWHTEAVEKALDVYREALRPLEATLTRARQADDADAKRKDISDIDRSLSGTLDAIYRLKSLLRSKNLQAERARCAIVTGPAGAGKSHLLAHIADQRLSNEEPTVLLVGQSFSEAEIWGQIGAFLDIAERTSGEILGLLSAAAERQGKRALVLIDAINEGVRHIFDGGLRASRIDGRFSLDLITIAPN
jgi:signal recognition particle GTPase